MVAVVVLGAQWGDEGKGKIVDYLAEKSDIVIRCQGGSNAGHTVVVGDDVHKLHLVPSGILYSGVQCIVGNGVVVDISVLLEELETLKKRGIDIGNFSISQRAHIVMPYHYKMDALQESLKGENKVGTTQRGIGPAYVDKASRHGIRLIDLLDEKVFEEKIDLNLSEKNTIFKAYDVELCDKAEIMEKYKVLAEKIRPYVKDIAYTLNDAIDDGKKVLFEGAQGTLLDIDHGSYPYVTSSNTTAGGICTGSGIGPTRIDKIVGVVKAYTTRVGGGPFPTELEDKMGKHLQDVGNEFGATTGRPRRCGWFDGVVARYSAMINGLTDLVVTKIDVLDDVQEIKICTGYEYKGEKIDAMPADLGDLADCKPIYETMPGWMEDTTKCRVFDDLPEAAQKYIVRLEEVCRVPVSVVAVGAERNQTILRREIF